MIINQRKEITGDEMLLEKNEYTVKDAGQEN